MLRRYFLSLLPAWLFHDCTRHADSAGNTRVQVGTAGTHIWLRAHATDPGRIQQAFTARDEAIELERDLAGLQFTAHCHPAAIGAALGQREGRVA